MYASNSLEVILDQISEADGLIEILLPALDAAVDTDGHETLLADSAAVASGLVASGHVGQGIGQVVKLAPIEHLSGHVVLEPENLGHLHLDAHGTSDVPQQVVTSVIDLLSLLNGAVVKPQDDIAIVAIVLEVRTGDGHGLISIMGEDSERAGRVKAQALDGLGVDKGVLQHRLDAETYGIPYVCGGLLLWMAQDG